MLPPVAKASNELTITDGNSRNNFQHTNDTNAALAIIRMLRRLHVQSVTVETRRPQRL